jgi:hypothetical protein
MADQVSSAKTDRAEQKKASAESQKGAAPEREFGVAFTFGGFELFLREVSNHSLPLGS